MFVALVNQFPANMYQADLLFFLIPFLILGKAYGGLDFTGQINVEKLELCKGSPNPYEAKITLKDNPKYAIVTANVKNDIDSAVKLRIKVEKNNGSNWNKVMDISDSICRVIHNFAPKAWVQFAKAAKPNLPTPCAKIKSGKYSIDKLQFSSNEFRVPLSWMGKFRATITIKNKSEELFCLYGEATLTK